MNNNETKVREPAGHFCLLVRSERGPITDFTLIVCASESNSEWIDIGDGMLLVLQTVY